MVTAQTRGSRAVGLTFDLRAPASFVVVRVSDSLLIHLYQSPYLAKLVVDIECLVCRTEQLWQSEERSGLSVLPTTRHSKRHSVQTKQEGNEIGKEEYRKQYD